MAGEDALQATWGEFESRDLHKKPMDKYFKTEDGKLINLVEHILEQLKLNPALKIYIATDSQNYGGNSVYVTAIVFRYGTRGAHVVHRKERLPRIRDNFKRLWQEAEYTINTAEMLKQEIPINIEALEFDYNNKKITKSTNLIPSITGWATSLGYKARVKPDEMIAAKAADHYCRL